SSGAWYLRFKVWSNSAETERLTINGNTGNVGIGTASPTDGRLTGDGGGSIYIRSGGYLMMRPAANDWDMRLRAVGSTTAGRLDVYSGGDLGNPIATF